MELGSRAKTTRNSKEECRVLKFAIYVNVQVHAINVISLLILS